MDRIRDRHGDYVWEIFTKYIKYFRINFNSPDRWEYKYKHIEFNGHDGCMGCYDPMSLDIPIEWFEDYDKALAEHEEELRKRQEEFDKEEKERKKRSKITAEKRERELFEKLREKYGK